MRTLPMRVDPVAGESFPSYMERLAGRHRVPISTILYHAGVLPADDHRTLPRGYGIALASRQIESVADVCGLEPDEVTAMLLCRYDGIAVDLSGVDLDRPDSVRAVALREWVHAAGSHVCPECIREDQAWRLAWKLPWSFACLRHERLLASFCPACGLRTGAGRGDGRTAPALPTRRPEPGHCLNRAAPGTGEGRAARHCGFPLELVESESLADWPEMLEVQTELEGRLAGSDEAGEPLPFFKRMRSLSAFVLAVAGATDLGALPLSAHRAWEAHVDARDARDTDRRQLRANGVDGRRGPRSRYWLRAPDDAALMAAVLPTAFVIERAREEGREALEQILRPLADGARRARPGDAYSLPQWFSFPEDITDVYQGLLRANSSRFVLGSPALEEPTGIDPNSVPKLFWRDPFEKELAPFFVGRMGESYARRFCSMAVLRIGAQRTWVEAGEAIGINRTWARQLGNRGASVVGRENRDEFWAVVHRHGDALTGADEPVNYRRREADLQDLRDIDRDDWLRLCKEAGIHPGKAGGRSRYAAAWLWAELTSGDWREAPAFGGVASESDREVFRRFTRELLPIIRSYLIALQEGASGRGQARHCDHD